jgi:uncharacterized protein
MAKDMIYTIAMILLIIGGLNWGLVGLFEVDLVELLFGAAPLIQRIVYILVGLSAVYVAIKFSMRDDRH